MPALTSREAARERLRKVFEERLEKFIPRDHSVPLQGSTFDIFCNNDVREDIVCNHICLCGAKPIWHRTKEILDRFYDAITLDILAKSQAEVQHLMPAFK